MFPYSFNNIYGYLRFSNMCMSSQAIEEKLKRDCSVEELLDEDEIIQEMKNQNNKLISFFNKDNVKRLVEYITIMPKEDDHKLGYRYPFMASEILNCDICKINDYFISTDLELIIKERKKSGVSNTDSDLRLSDDQGVIQKEEEESKKEIDQVEQVSERIVITEGKALPEEETKSDSEVQPSEQVNINEYENLQKSKIDLLDNLLNFIDTDEELNYVLAGYFSKFLLHLINKYPQRIINYMYNEKNHILYRIIQHCHNKSISELVSKILIVENYGELKLNEDVRHNLIIKLFSRIGLDLDMEKINNIVSCIIELTENKQLLEKIANDEIILKILFEQLVIVSAGMNDYNYNEILNILVNILKFISIEGLKAPSHAVNSDDIVNSENVFNNTVLSEMILVNLELILQNFDVRNSGAEAYQLEGTFGTTFIPLGSKRVRIVEFILCAFNYFKNVPILLDNLLIKAKFFEKLFYYLFQYEWNNLFQYHFDTLLKYYLKNVANHTGLTRYLFSELKILNLIASHNDKYSFTSSRTIQRGYFPVVIDMANSIRHSNDQIIRSAFSEEWTNFMDTIVYPNIKLFERKLCVHEPSIQDDEFKFEKDIIPSESDSNPFKSNKDDLLFGGIEESDWTGSKGDQHGNNFIEDINNFEFVDENKHDLKYDESHVIVDELDLDNFNDANYWKKSQVSVDDAEKILAELEL